MTDGLILPPGAGQGISAAGMTLKVGAGQSPTWSRPGPPDQNEISALRARHDIQQLTPLNPGWAR
jgi:hypothetical protein